MEANIWRELSTSYKSVVFTACQQQAGSIFVNPDIQRIWKQITKSDILFDSTANLLFCDSKVCNMKEHLRYLENLFNWYNFFIFFPTHYPNINKVLFISSQLTSEKIQQQSFCRIGCCSKFLASSIFTMDKN